MIEEDISREFETLHTLPWGGGGEMGLSLLFT